MNKKRLRAIFQKLDDAYPKADTELIYKNLFELLIAVVLSAQSTDVQVNKVTAQFFAKVDSPEKMMELSVEEIEQHIKGVGLYRSKARNIRKIAEILLTQYGGEVPADFEALLALPGVGRKTANVVMAVGFNFPALGVDTHVQRVANRIGLVNTKTPVKTELKLKELFPEQYWSKLHHLLIHHGRRTCKARQPLCDTCVIREYCLQKI